MLICCCVFILLGDCAFYQNPYTSAVSVPIFPIHLYPMMLTCWLVSSFVSVISAMLALVAFRSDSMLFILLLMPLTLIVIMVICLFFLILVLFFFFGRLGRPSFLAGIILMLVGPNVTFFPFWWVFLLMGGGLGLMVFSLLNLALVLLSSVGFCYLIGVCGGSPFPLHCIVFCVWMNFYFCCCGGVGIFHSGGVFSGHGGPCPSDFRCWCAVDWSSDHWDELRVCYQL